MTDEELATIVEALGRARTRGARLARAAVDGIDGEAAGYRVQWRHGRRLAGRSHRLQFVQRQLSSCR